MAVRSSFPDLSEPAKHRGHNIYELVQIAIDLGYAVTPIPLRSGNHVYQ